jgi:hypothetical protein
MESDIWCDQYAFNRVVRPTWPSTYPERTALTKEMVLHLISECDELLRASGAWKSHRKQDIPENRAQILAELTDIRKYWMTVAQIWGFNEGELDDAYWRKSAAVRQRYVEEWVHQLTGPIVILDLDNVLCDYPRGLVQWLRNTPWQDKVGASDAALTELAAGVEWIDANTLRVSPQIWMEIKHAFRTSGAKRTLPMRPKAAEFTRWCRDQGWTIIILTSRPIDRYPTLYDDTLSWLNQGAFAYDYIWWGFDKSHPINVRDIGKQVVFAVDDEEQFVQQYLKAGIRTYWMQRHNDLHPSKLDGEQLVCVTSVCDIMDKEKERQHGNSL